ncbi:hypothetical protein OESDEN_07014 [Oesophagostomum dentatum]|uniref:7TM GPCR serpentine receptor class x (Srx) domain-containing protein n=1 Tax=Oesophagostomum dentatum TaxID=61180 RepID=A0A0B1TAB6_OESDE|nr:hypothetical protein OESDEN_07014 [Oesophagostomum dentatum]
MLIILATPNTLGHWGYLLASLAFALYRFGVFISKTFADMQYCIKALLISPWLFTCIITFGTTALGCYKRYNRMSLGYTFNCAKCDLFFGITYSDFNSTAGQTIPLVMIAIYAVIIVTLYRKHKSGDSNSRKTLADLKLALQFFVICCFQYLETYLFYLIPTVGKGAAWSVLLMNSIGSYKF